jgi:hypothetical protein
MRATIESGMNLSSRIPIDDVTLIQQGQRERLVIERSRKLDPVPKIEEGIVHDCVLMPAWMMTGKSQPKFLHKIRLPHSPIRLEPASARQGLQQALTLPAVEAPTPSLHQDGIELLGTRTATQSRFQQPPQVNRLQLK